MQTASSHLTTPSLFTPITIGKLSLPNRIFMAPLTRLRAAEPGDLPTPLMQQYYQQRASAGLIISEATQISAQAKGSSGAPGLHSDQQIAAWQRITKAVHQQHGHIAVQLWHTGRMSHCLVQPAGKPPVAPSALQAGCHVSVRNAQGTIERLFASMPRALETAEIPQIIGQFRQAILNARDASFDLVELHAANGYLLHQFLSPVSNQRNDRYGGSMEKRARLLLEVVDAACTVWQPERIGIRLSPLGVMNHLDNGDQHQREAALYVVQQLAQRQLAYLHFAEPEQNKAQYFSEAFRTELRNRYSGILIGAGGYNQQFASELISKGYIDAAAFGRLFIANPDLVRRFRTNAPLTVPDEDTFFAGGEKGYTDYPALSCG